MTTRRFVKDESGMVMVLAIIMIVLLGVMGAGLLTFADRDLNTLSEQNRGQKAFEVADAGVGVAKQQLTSDCVGNITCVGHYDDFGPNVPADQEGPEDIKWSWAKGGVTLNDLDGDGNVTTVDSVNVTIDYRIQAQNFKIISTGTYGESKRKIEAILNAEGGSSEGEGIGHPVYYTPSGITIEGDPALGDVSLSGTSMFTEQDIVIEGLQSTRPLNAIEPEGRAFKTDYEDSGTQGIFQLDGTNDFLEDWYTPGWDAPKPQGDWNTEPRMGHAGDEIGDYPNNRGCARDNVSCISPGFAAEGKICGVPANSNIGNCDSRTSIADGVYAYDCTTGPVPASVTDPSLFCPRDAAAGEVSRGNDLTFVEKQPTVDPTTGQMSWGDNEDGTLTYPFPKLKPREARLKAIAREQQAEGTGGYYYKGCSPPWSTIWNHPQQDEEDVIFIDAGGCPDPIDMTFGGTQDAIMVVWCGETHQTNDTKFRGILMNLTGDGLNPDGSSFASNCEGDMTKGVYTVDEGSEMWGWLYSEGGTDTRSGIVISSVGTTNGNPTELHFRSGATWNFLDDTFSSPSTPTEISVMGWRELYE